MNGVTRNYMTEYEYGNIGVVSIEDLMWEYRQWGLAILLMKRDTAVKDVLKLRKLI